MYIHVQYIHTTYLTMYCTGSAFIKLVDDARLIARFERRKTPGGVD